MNFSVLMSVYDKENAIFFSEAIESITNQSLKANEIILVIDGTINEKLQTVVSKYTLQFKELKVVELNINVGLGKALNRGLLECSNEIVIRMDTDDICSPRRFEKLINIFVEHPNFDVVGSWIEEFNNEPGDYKKVRRVKKYSSEINNQCKNRSPMNHPAVAFKKTSVINAGGYKHFPLLEDYYLWFRMIKEGYIFYNIQESLMYLRVGNDMVGRRWGWNYLLNEYRLFKIMYDDKFISLFGFMKNLAIRLPLRTFPKPLLKFFYKYFLRI